MHFLCNTCIRKKLIFIWNGHGILKHVNNEHINIFVNLLFFHGGGGVNSKKNDHGGCKNNIWKMFLKTYIIYINYQNMHMLSTPHYDPMGWRVCEDRDSGRLWVWPIQAQRNLVVSAVILIKDSFCFKQDPDTVGIVVCLKYRREVIRRRDH